MLDTTDYSKATAWCGPSALAMLCRIPLRDATEHLSRIRGEAYSELSGVWPEEVIIALQERGYRARPVDIIGRYPDLTHGPTLKRYFRERPASEKVLPTLIDVGNHFLTGHFDMAGDNRTRRMIPWPQFPKLSRLVKAVHIIERRTT